MTRRRLHIVRISEYVVPSPGGREVHVRELSRRQTARGHIVLLLFRVGGQSGWAFDAAQLLRRTGVRRRLPHALVSTLFLAAALLRLARRRRRTDLVHLHGDYLEALSAGAVRLLGIPSVLTLHGRLSPRVLGRIGFVYRLPSHIVAVSPAIAAQLDGAGVRPEKVTVQHSGVDSEIFFPLSRAGRNPPFRVVVASALIPLKDHATLLEAIELLTREGLDIQLEVAGLGPERARLEREAGPNVRFHGQLDQRSLADLMRSCHVAALASVDTPTAGEGTPTFLMEALACGVPFVATHTGGVANLAAQSEAGVVVPQRAPHAFAQALRALATDVALYERYRRSALIFAPRLDWDVVADRIDCLMEAIIGQDSVGTAGSSR
jgi:glycosyltransferase involved in cell wall biosynthesis